MGYRLNDVAAYLGRDAATLATLLSRLQEQFENYSEETREIERLAQIVES